MKASLVRLAYLNASRNRARSALTAGMIVAGTALFIIALSWLDGIWNTILEDSADALGHVRVVTHAYAERESLNPIDENIEDVAPVLDALRAHSQVKAAFPVINTGVTLTVGEEIGDVFGLVTGAPTPYFTEHLDADAKLIEGRWFRVGQSELVMGKKLAERTGATLGDEVVLLGQTQDGSMSPVKRTLVGIVASGGPSIDRRVFVDLATLQWMVDIPTGATQIIAYGDSYARVHDLFERLAQDPALADLNVKHWEQLPPWDTQLGMMKGIRTMVMVLVIFLSGLGVWNTMMMSVLERTTEIGVLRAMGMTRMGAVFVFVVEATTIAVLGGAVGIVAGVLPTLYMETQGITFPESLRAKVDMPMSETMFAELTLEIVILAYGTALLTALIGSFFPALRAASISPVSAMRRHQ